MREYRQDSHTRSLVIWTILCTLTAAVLFYHSHKVVSRALKAEEILAGVALLIFGPASLTVYLVRARRLYVAILEHGLAVGGRGVIPWSDVLQVTRLRPRFRKTSGPTEVSEFSPDSLPDAGGCADGCATGLGELLAVIGIVIAALFAIWVIVAVFVPLIVIPLLEVFAPFGDRITVTTRSSGRLVLRDLSDADEFMRRVAAYRPTSER